MWLSCHYVLGCHYDLLTIYIFNAKHMIDILLRLAKRALCAVLVAISVAFAASAQHIAVNGIVSDSDGQPLIGVNVLEKGTRNGAMTDGEGRYSLNVGSQKAVLVISCIGFVTQEIIVGTNQIINVSLNADNQNLDEVVVIGYGTAKKKDLTGAISTVRAENLEKQAPVSVQDILRANATGVSVGASVNTDGSTSVQIRGKNTLSAGSSPLYVLDGVIYNGSLVDINPMDIQSIDVLKDASSVAVYGAKAANGVIAITTKKGNTGKPVINFNSNVGWAKAIAIPAVVDGKGFIEFRKEYSESLLTKDELNAKKGMYSDPRQLSNMGVDPLTWYNYDQSQPATSVPGEQTMVTKWLSRLNFKTPEIENYLAGRETDWTDLVFQTGFLQDYTASVSNRTDNFSYYLSLGYADREGVKTDDRFITYRTRLNLESKVTSFLTVGLNSQFSKKDRGFLSADVVQRMYDSPWTANEIDDPDSPYRMYPSGDNNTKNPFFDNYYRDRKDMEHTLNANLYAIVKLPFGIEYQLNFNPYWRWYEYMNHDSSKHPEWAGDGGRVTRRNDKEYNWIFDNIFKWSHEFGKDHRLDATFLINAEKNQYWRTDATATQFTPSDVLGYHNIGAGTVPLNSSDDTYRTGDALMGRLFYSFRNKYMVTASIRRDGYSAFGQENPRAAFPAVALAWVFSSEKFFEPVSDWFSYGKLRLSWGQNGNRDIGQYVALSSLNSSLTPYIDKNGNPYVTSQVYVNRMSNKGLKWERTTSYNAGLDFGFFGDRIRGSMETYFSQTSDLLVNRRLPSVTGFASVAANLGKLDNRGFELTLNGTILKHDDFVWNSSGSFSFNRRKLKALYGDMEDILDENGKVIGRKESDDPTNGWFIGHDPDQIWDYEVDGIWQLGQEEEASKYGCKPGDFHFVDQNDDGVLDNSDKTFQGYFTPRFYWTWSNEVSYKGVSLSMMIYSQLGHYDYYNHVSNSGGMFDRFTTYDQPRWTRDNPTNSYGRIGSYRFSNIYHKKSFVRVGDVTLSYSVPKSFLKKFNLQAMRLSLSAHNPFTFTSWDFFDVEATQSNRDNTAYGRKSFNVGVNITL
jgi:TonB-linked SusC/RagA family outer membrane protein